MAVCFWLPFRGFLEKDRPIRNRNHQMEEVQGWTVKSHVFAWTTATAMGKLKLAPQNGETKAPSPPHTGALLRCKGEVVVRPFGSSHGTQKTKQCLAQGVLCTLHIVCFALTCGARASRKPKPVQKKEHLRAGDVWVHLQMGTLQKSRSLLGGAKWIFSPSSVVCP